MIKSLSAFFPVYNEEKNIANTVEDAFKVLKKYNFPWEVIIVNDGSKDKTLAISQKIASKYGQVRIVNQQNGGYGMAIRAGLRNVKYEWIIYTDADGQFDFSEVAKFLAVCDHVDAIWGYRLKRQDPFYRLLFSYFWGISVRLLTGVLLKDVNCGFKMFRKSAIKKIEPLKSTRGAMINPELALKFNRAGFKILEVGVNHYPRLFGRPTGASLKVIIQSYLELFRLWLKNS